MSVRIHACDRAAVTSLLMPDRIRQEITYFVASAGEEGVPELPSGEFWIHARDARLLLDEGVITIVSPLDSAARTEMEISETQEALLEWLVRNEVQHLRLENC